MTIINNTGHSIIIGAVTILRFSTGTVDDAAWDAAFDSSEALRSEVAKGFITAYDDGSEPVYPPVAPGTEFVKEFTAAASTGFVWVDNVLTVTHSLNSNVAKVEIFDNNGNSLVYTSENVDQNTTKIYFPIADIPITETYRIRVF
jgi:hypothetical protein